MGQTLTIGHLLSIMNTCVSSQFNCTEVRITATPNNENLRFQVHIVDGKINERTWKKVEILWPKTITFVSLLCNYSPDDISCSLKSRNYDFIGHEHSLWHALSSLRIQWWKTWQLSVKVSTYKSQMRSRQTMNESHSRQDSLYINAQLIISATKSS